MRTQRANTIGRWRFARSDVILHVFGIECRKPYLISSWCWDFITIFVRSTFPSTAFAEMGLREQYAAGIPHWEFVHFGTLQAAECSFKLASGSGFRRLARLFSQSRQFHNLLLAGEFILIRMRIIIFIVFRFVGLYTWPYDCSGSRRPTPRIYQCHTVYVYSVPSITFGFKIFSKCRLLSINPIATSAKFCLCLVSGHW